MHQYNSYLCHAFTQKAASTHLIDCLFSMKWIIMRDRLNIYVRWLIKLTFRYIQVIIPKAIVTICTNEYDMPDSQYDDANVFLQKMCKIPATVF